MRTPTRSPRGLTLPELVIVVALTGIVAVIATPLLFHGVKPITFLPKAVTVNYAATDIIHQLVEGGLSTLPDTATTNNMVYGLRFTGRPFAGQTNTIWFAQPNQVGYVNTGAQTVLVRLNGTTVERNLVPTGTTCTAIPGSLTWETIPEAPPIPVNVVTGALFSYFDVNNATITPNANGCPPATTIRRVDVAFTAQTGNGVFDQGDAQEPMRSAVAIRTP